MEDKEMRARKVRFRFAFALMLCASTALAHHSVTIYDYSKVVTKSGTVVAVDWTNPHSYLHLIIIGASGEEEKWRLEYGTPGINARMGWRKDSIKPGDKVTVTFCPIRDGTYEGALRSAQFPDGHILYAPAYYFKLDSSGGPTNAAAPSATVPGSPKTPQ